MPVEPYTLRELLRMHHDNWPESATQTHDFIVLFNTVRHQGFSRARIAMAGQGLSPAEFDVLAALRRSPEPYEQTPTEVRRRMVITSGGLTKLLAQLAGRGLIVLTGQLRDRRSKLVRLTPAGRQRVEQAMTQLLADEERWLMQALDVTEREQLLRLLNRLFDTARPHSAASS